MKTLILGGIRSGKSRLAQRMAGDSTGSGAGTRVIVVATALAGDAEMRRRIERHRQDRPVHWQVVEEPLELGECLTRNAADDTCLLVDCLTLWLTQALTGPDADACFAARRDAFLGAVSVCRGRLILVSNETGLGIMPMGALSRQFCDEAGWLHQALAGQCDQVIQTVAGLPLYLKGGPAG